MRKYRINKKKLTDEELDQFKDFDSVLDKLSKNPGLPNEGGTSSASMFGAIKGIALLLALVAGIWYLVDRWSGKEEMEPGLVSETVIESEVSSEDTIAYKVNPPIQGEDVSYEEFTMEATEGAELISDNKSIIQIPRNSFKDSMGNLVKGKVTIKYREFHSTYEIFLSGIPMQYDSAGANYTFESAGMFEIYAEQDGKKLSNNLEKEIIVDLVSQNSEDKFNNYFFNKERGEWEYQSKSSMESLEEPNQVVAQNEKIEKTVVQDNVEKPIMPSYPKVLEDEYSFTIDFDKKKFNELNEKVVFQVDKARSNFSSRFYDVKWESIKLERSTIENRYEVQLQKAGKTIKVICYPALPEEEYSRLKEKYKSDLARYNQYIGQTTNESSKVAYERDYLDEKSTSIAQYATYSKRRFSVRRIFRIATLGIWNADYPIVLYKAKLKQAVPHFTMDHEPIAVKKVYNSVKNHNAYFVGSQGQPISYSKRKKNRIWVVTEDDQVGIPETTDFNKAKKGEHTFELTLYPSETGVKKIRELLR